MEDKRSKLTPPVEEEVKIETNEDVGGEAIEEDESFVYDVYYRDISTSIDSETPNGSGGAGGIDVGSGAGMKRIGKLAGLEQDQLIDGEVESEEEDEADQDSNEENDYRNDYPDDGESEDALSEVNSEDEY